MKALKMATSKGVIQGYTDVAAVDGKYQIMVEAQALIADNPLRQRDERFSTQARHKAAPDPLHDKSDRKKKAAIYQPSDFTYDADARTCVCPAGKLLYGNGRVCCTKGLRSIRFHGAERDCVPCSQRDRCLRTPQKTKTRQVAFFHGKAVNAAESYSDKTKQRIDSPAGRMRCGRRFAMVDQVFGNVRYKTRGWIASPCAGKPKSMGSGSCSAWCTTSRSWRIMATQSSHGERGGHYACRSES